MIKTVTGPVKAGKSKKLIEIYEALMSTDNKVQVFSSKFSLTHGESVVSRYGTNIKAIPINSLFDIMHHVNHDTKSILIDEFQFLQMGTSDLKSFFDKYHYDYDFYFFGLNLDYQKRPFELMAYAMSYADVNERIGGYCDLCQGIPSKFSLRLENEEPASIDTDGKIILLDGQDGDTVIQYKSICDQCWQTLYCNREGK